MTVRLPDVRLPIGFALEFLADGRTPMRALSDVAVLAGARELAREFDRMLELGSGGDYYKTMLAPVMTVETSNVVPGSDHLLDMTRLDLPDASCGLLMSAFAVEHFFEVDRSFAEAARVLRPGGVYFLVAPFMYYYHAAPDDYFRFTGSAIRELAARHGLQMESMSSLGDRWLLFAEFLHEKAILGSRHGAAVRAAFRLLALPMLLFSLARGRPDPRFAMGHAVILRRPLGSEAR